MNAAATSASLKEARAAAEHAARASYGRLLAYLAAQWRDVEAAEDALADAFAAALAHWPDKGVPGNPEAWLMTAARRKLLDAARRAKTRAGAHAEIELLSMRCEEGGEIPDKRLELMLACAHPAIDPTARAPLMLQTVLGLSAEKIAAAFLVKPAAMAQRLVRAKTKIRAAGIPFERPGADDMAVRIEDVLRAVYAAFGAAWNDVDGADERSRALVSEAIWLARLIVQLAPHSAEAWGLLALMLHCEARRRARRDAKGRYMPLTEQDAALWSRDMIAEAESALAKAAALQSMGRFQLEAAIQSAHARRAFGEETDWRAIALLYDGLIRLEPAIGALVARAAAHGQARGAEAGLAALQGAPEARVADYQPYWAVRAHLLAQADRFDEARSAYQRAIGLCEDPAMRLFLQARARKLDGA